MYADLPYYLSTAPGAQKVSRFLRERGGLQGVLRSLTWQQQWDNLIASYEWINAHPLPDNASSDMLATRQLVIAALVRAQASLQSAQTGGVVSSVAQADYDRAVQAYQAHVRTMAQQETPSAFSLWLAGLGLDVGNPLAKAGMAAGLALAAVVIVPHLIAASKGRANA